MRTLQLAACRDVTRPLYKTAFVATIWRTLRKKESLEYNMIPNSARKVSRRILGKKRSLECGMAPGSAWCGWGDSNPYDRSHWILNPGRLPIPPHPHTKPYFILNAVGLQEVMQKCITSKKIRNFYGEKRLGYQKTLILLKGILWLGETTIHPDFWQRIRKYSRKG